MKNNVVKIDEVFRLSYWRNFKLRTYWRNFLFRIDEISNFVPIDEISYFGLTKFRDSYWRNFVFRIDEISYFVPIDEISYFVLTKYHVNFLHIILHLCIKISHLSSFFLICRRNLINIRKGAKKQWNILIHRQAYFVFRIDEIPRQFSPHYSSPDYFCIKISHLSSFLKIYQKSKFHVIICGVESKHGLTHIFLGIESVQTFF